LPAAGEGGVWRIISGIGGYFENANKPDTRFYGTDGKSYLLRWTILNVCDSSTDETNISFLPFPSCPGVPSFIYGGQNYNTVQIGSQCWMKENLNIGTMVMSMNTGISHSECSNNGVIENIAAITTLRCVMSMADCTNGMR